jgi:hypothetical protein
MDYHKAIEKWKTELADEAWIGVDLDATFAEHGAWIGPLHIGKPIPKMVERVKKWLAEGKKVKVFTARVSEKNPALRATIIEAIQEWTEACVGQRLEVTNEKDYAMVEVWDDRAVQVIPNTGERADGRD